MKKRPALYVVAILTLAVMSAWAADLSGKWTAQVQGRGGQTRETTFTFKVEEEKLTGTVSGGQNETPIADGKISVDEISFTVTMQRQGNTIKMFFFKQKAAYEIKFTRTREGSD